jgi:DNA primase
MRTGFFDRFGGRVMFPIHSLSGQVLGFGGRVLKTDVKTAKYLNSPESEIYHKGRILYGIFQAQKIHHTGGSVLSG